MDLLVTEFRDYLIKTYGLHPETFSIYSTMLKRYFDASFYDRYSISDILVPDLNYHSKDECFRLMAHQIKFELVRTIIDKGNDLYETLRIMFNVKPVEDGYLVSDKEDGNEKLVNNGFDAFGVLTPKLIFNPDRLMMEIYRGMVVINTNGSDYRHIETKINELTPERIDLEVYVVFYNKNSERYSRVNKIASRLFAEAENCVFAMDDGNIKKLLPSQHPDWLNKITNPMDLYESPVNTWLSTQIPLIKSENLYYGNNLYVNTPDCVFIFVEDCWIPSNLEWLVNNGNLIPTRIGNEVTIYKNMMGTVDA